jgi:hypothetical protein
VLGRGVLAAVVLIRIDVRGAIAAERLAAGLVRARHRASAMDDASRERAVAEQRGFADAALLACAETAMAAAAENRVPTVAHRNSFAHGHVLVRPQFAQNRYPMTACIE